jgi:hypothetical protein
MESWLKLYVAARSACLSDTDRVQLLSWLRDSMLVRKRTSMERDAGLHSSEGGGSRCGLAALASACGREEAK